jgi:hypothetical protein
VDKLMGKYLLVFIAFIFVACSGKREDNYTKTLDSLALVLDSTKNRFLKIDFEKAKKTELKVADDILKIRSFLNIKDQEKYNTLIENYSLAGKFELSDSDSANIPNSKPQQMLAKQFEYSFNQLKNLKHDYLSNKIDEKKSLEYLNTEKNAIDKLREYVTKKNEYYSRNFFLVDSLTPQINEIIEKSK